MDGSNLDRSLELVALDQHQTPFSTLSSLHHRITINTYNNVDSDGRRSDSSYYGEETEIRSKEGMSQLRRLIVIPPTYIISGTQ